MGKQESFTSGVAIALTVISGPIPAGSPIIMPTRGLRRFIFPANPSRRATLSRNAAGCKTLNDVFLHQESQDEHWQGYDGCRRAQGPPTDGLVSEEVEYRH